jgi:hypothetical protein
MSMSVRVRVRATVERVKGRGKRRLKQKGSV